MEQEEPDALDVLFNAKDNLRAIKENLNEKVAEALRERRLLRYQSKKNVPTYDDCDEVPLSIRIARNNKKKKSPAEAKTRPSRKCSRKKTLESNTDTCTQSINDVVILTDSDDDVICEDPVINNLHDISLDLNESDFKDSTLDDEEENWLVSVKVNWMNRNVHIFELREHQTFSIVFQELAEKENVARKNILLILRDKIFITEEDTPKSLNLSIIDIIEGGITKEIINEVSERKGTLNKDMLQFKCVLKDKKKPLLVNIKKTDQMRCLMVKASEQLECALEKLKFIFEGDELDSEATPVDLDLEGGEVIEVAIRN